MKKILPLMMIAFLAFVSNLYSSGKLFKQGKVTEFPSKTYGNIKMIKLPGGSFNMGSPSSEKGRYHFEGPVHRVKLSSFFISETEVTQGQWKELMGSNPSEFKNRDDYPVENVSWYDAVEFCNKLSDKYGLEKVYEIDKSKKDLNNKNKRDLKSWLVKANFSKKGFRLPTEAEWEYACRAGTTTAFHFGDSLKSNMANFTDSKQNNSSKGEDQGKTTPVKSFKPNAWGLYDMHGNVYEWCWDWYSNNYYRQSPVNNPKGPVSSEYRVLRGGSWYNYVNDLRSASRSISDPDDRYGSYGFRITRTL